MTTAQWRTVTLVLGVVFLVLVALLVVVVLGRSGGGGAEATATASASASVGPSAAGESTSPSATPEASATGAASPSAGSSPTAAADVPGARAVIRDLGIDDPGSPQAKPRVFVFASEGGGDVMAKLQAASGGKVELCIYPGTLAKPLGDKACLRNAGGILTGHHKGKKPFTWTLTLTGVKGGTTPTADVRIDWPAIAPKLEMTNVRLQGTGAEPYDRVTVDLGSRPQAGALSFVADWDGADEQPYKATITDRATGAILDQASGTGAGVDLKADIAAGQRTQIELLNTAPLVAVEVLAALVLTWP